MSVRAAYLRHLGLITVVSVVALTRSWVNAALAGTGSGHW